ncbi:TPA: hypothetical protein F6W58_23085 [Serratia marcescens]|nr:hypothetical protein [Serratia marcescens]HAU4321574.1 hypothetical protein [Serratia marcescens]
MQLHERPQAAPVLVWQGMKSAFSCMQNHAPYACTRNLRRASQEKGVLGEAEGECPAMLSRAAGRRMLSAV